MYLFMLAALGAVLAMLLLELAVEKLFGRRKLSKKDGIRTRPIHSLILGRQEQKPPSYFRLKVKFSDLGH